MSTKAEVVSTWRDAKRQIIAIMRDSPELVLTDEELALMFECEPYSSEYQFSLWSLRRSLEREGIWFLRLPDKAYKIANSVEILDVLVEKQKKKQESSLARQSLQLSSIDVSKLDSERKDRYDRWCAKSALLVAYHHQLTLDKVEPGIPVKPDRVKMIEIISNNEEEY